MTFLRLASRRGWIADRRVDSVDAGKLRVSYLAEDVTAELLEQQESSRCDASVPSLNSSALSVSSASFYSTVSASCVATPEGVRRRRRRRARRKDGGGENKFAAGGGNSRIGKVGSDHSFDSSSRLAAGEDGGGGGGGAEEPSRSRHLMRVLAPLGLRILDAPHFQVRSLGISTAFLEFAI